MAVCVAPHEHVLFTTLHKEHSFDKLVSESVPITEQVRKKVGAILGLVPEVGFARG